MAQNVDPHLTGGAGPAAGRPRKHAEDNLRLKDNHAVTKRLQKELMELMRSADRGISAFPESENLFRWIGTIGGADGTAYAGQTYKLSLDFPNAYPYSAPCVKFVTPCFHPNVDPATGTICLDILKDKWSALYDVRTVLISIQSLLAEPNVHSPLNAHAAELWADRAEYARHLAEYYAKHRDS